MLQVKSNIQNGKRNLRIWLDQKLKGNQNERDLPDGNMIQMNPDLLNILSHSNKDIDNQKLMDYLSGKLSEKERQEVEQMVLIARFS